MMERFCSSSSGLRAPPPHHLHKILTILRFSGWGRNLTFPSVALTPEHLVSSQRLSCLGSVCFFIRNKKPWWRLSEVRERVNKPGGRRGQKGPIKSKQANLLCGLGVIKSVGLSGNRPQSQRSSSGTLSVCVYVSMMACPQEGGSLASRRSVAMIFRVNIINEMKSELSQVRRN